MAAAIQATDIKYFQTAGNLGGAITANEIVSGSMNNMFRTITSAEALSGITLYGIMYVKQTSAYSGTAVKSWIQANTPSADTTVEIGLGTAGKNAVEQTIASETTAPVGVTFSSAVDEPSAIALPDLNTDEYVAIHVKYVVSPNAVETALDNVTITTKMDSPAL